VTGCGAGVLRGSQACPDRGVEELVSHVVLCVCQQCVQVCGAVVLFPLGLLWYIAVKALVP
jgi:hypothetical protein